MPSNIENNAGKYDVGFSLASVNITSGLTVVTTTQASYHGISIMASNTRTFVFVYDDSAATTGNLVDLMIVQTTAAILADKYIPVLARHGLTVAITGAGARGVIFYGPKG